MARDVDSWGQAVHLWQKGNLQPFPGLEKNAASRGSRGRNSEDLALNRRTGFPSAVTVTQAASTSNAHHSWQRETLIGFCEAPAVGSNRPRRFARPREYSALVSMVFLSLALTVQTQSNLPDGPGKVVVERMCTTCHGLNVSHGAEDDESTLGRSGGRHGLARRGGHRRRRQAGCRVPFPEFWQGPFPGRKRRNCGGAGEQCGAVDRERTRDGYVSINKTRRGK